MLRITVRLFVAILLVAFAPACSGTLLEFSGAFQHPPYPLNTGKQALVASLMENRGSYVVGVSTHGSMSNAIQYNHIYAAHITLYTTNFNPSNFCNTGKLHAVRLDTTSTVDALVCTKADATSYVEYAEIQPDFTNGARVTVSRQATNLRGCAPDWHGLLGDLNKDGVVDLLCVSAWHSGETQRIESYARFGMKSNNRFTGFSSTQSWRKTQTPTVNTNRLVDGNNVAVDLLDLENDGNLDLVLSTLYTPGVSNPAEGSNKNRCPVFVMSLSSTSSYTWMRTNTKGIISKDNCGYSVSWEDMNGDGYVDQIRGNQATGDVKVFLNRASKFIEFESVDGVANYDNVSCKGRWFALHSNINGNQQFNDLVCADAVNNKVWVSRSRGCGNYRQGGICEHQVCAWHKPGVIKPDAWLKSNPSSFNWNTYVSEDLSLGFVPQPQGFMVNFTTSTSTLAFESYVVEIDGKAETNKVEVTSPACVDTNGGKQWIRDPKAALISKKNVGEEVQVAVKCLWNSDNRFIPSSDWIGKTSNLRPIPTVTRVLRVEFMTMLTISVHDKNQNGVPSCAIDYALDSSPNTWVTTSFLTDESGAVDVSLVIEGIADNTNILKLRFRARKMSGEFPHEIVGCPENVCGTNAFVVSDMTHLPPPSSVTALKFQDNSAVTISGTVQSDFTTDGNTCIIAGATILAFSEAGGKVAQTISSTQGEFMLSVPLLQQDIYLRVEYRNRTEWSSVTHQNLVEGGVRVTDEINNVVILDSTRRTTTIVAGYTRCGFGSGNVVATLSSPSCTKDIVFTRSAASYKFDVSIPPSIYEFDLDYSGDADSNTLNSHFNIRKSLENETTLDVLDNDNVIYANAHVPPTLLLQDISPTGMVPSPEVCGNEDKFDSILEGNAVSDLKLVLLETYGNEQCVETDPRVQLRIAAELGATGSDCDWTNQDTTTLGGCVVNVAKDGSHVLASVLAASPTVIPSGKSVKDVLREVKVSVHNPFLWLNGVIGDELKLGSLKFLVVGREIVNADAVVSVPESYPLAFLYAPPTSPNGGSVATLVLSETVEVSTETSYYKQVDDTLDVAAALTIGAEVSVCVFGTVCRDVLEVSGSVGTSASIEQSREQFKQNKINTKSTTSSLTLSTPEGASGDAGNMVLVAGMTASYMRSRLHSFDNSTCAVSVQEQTAWSKEVKSLIFMSRRDSVGEMNKARETARVARANLERSDLNAEERKANHLTLIKGESGVAAWASLLSYWDKDMLDAELYPVDLSTLVGDGSADTSTLTIGSSEVSLDYEWTSRTNRIRDYIGYSSFSKLDVNAALEVTVVGIGSSTELSSGVSSTTTYDRVTTEDVANVNSYSVSFVEPDVEDQISFEVFRSPLSNTLVFKTKGGMTRCPHIQGTSAHEKISAKITQQPKFITENDGNFVLTISAFDMEDFESGEKKEVDLVIEVESLLPVSFSIGGTPLNQGFDMKLAAGEEKSATIRFVRDDPDITRVTVNGVVRSKCDDSIEAPFVLTVAWQEPTCDQLEWSGELKDALNSWVAHGEEFMMEVRNANLRQPWSSSPQLSLWYRLGLGVEEWQEFPSSLVEVKVNEDGTLATLAVATEEMRSLMQDSVPYLIEVRSPCGSKLTQSGPRHGMIDNIGPKVMSWTTLQSLSAASLSRNVEVIGIMFDEPINCTSSDARMTLTVKDGDAVSNLDILCTANAHQVSGMLHLANSQAIEALSGKVVKVRFDGFSDLWGNTFESGFFEREYQLPDLSSIQDLPSAAAQPDYSGVTQQAVAGGQKSSLPTPSLNSFSTVRDGVKAPGTEVIIGAVAGAVLGVAGLGAAIWYKTHQGSHTSVEKELAISADLEKEIDSPHFDMNDL